MKREYLDFWDQFGNTFKSKDGRYEAIKAKNGSFKLWNRKTNKVSGIFCDDDTLNDYVGYVKNGSCTSSVGAKGYGDFSI